MNHNKKINSSFTKYLLYAILIVFAAPYFFNQDRSDTVMKIGNTQISRQELYRASILARQERLPAIFSQLFFILREEATFFTNPYPKSLRNLLHSTVFSLNTNEEHVQQYIESMPNNQQNGEYSFAQYSDTLKKLGVTNIVFEREVNAWLVSKQLLYIPQLICLYIQQSPEFEKYVNNIWKAFLQVRTGSYEEVVSAMETKEITDKEVEDFYSLHANDFVSQPQAIFSCIKFENISDKQFQQILEELRNGSTFSDVEQKWHTKKMFIQVQEGTVTEVKIEKKAKSLLSKEFANTILQVMHPSLLNKPQIGADNNAKYIYTMSSFTEASTKAFEQVKELVKEKALIAKHVNTCKQLAKKMIQSAKISNTHKPIQAELSTILPAHYPNLKPSQNEKPLDDQTIAISRELFRLNNKQPVSVIMHNDKVFIVRLNKITYTKENNEQHHEQHHENLQKMILSDIYISLVTEYANNIYKHYD